VEFTGELDGSVQQPQVEFDFGESVSAKILRLEIQDLHQTEPAHVHIWEILFR
jgi:hypothetical protein